MLPSKWAGHFALLIYVGQYVGFPQCATFDWKVLFPGGVKL